MAAPVVFLIALVTTVIIDASTAAVGEWLPEFQWTSETFGGYEPLIRTSATNPSLVFVGGYTRNHSDWGSKAIFAFNATTGNVSWVTEVDPVQKSIKWILSTALGAQSIANGSIFYMHPEYRANSNCSTFSAYDENTGREEWSYTMPHAYTDGSIRMIEQPIYHDGLLYQLIVDCKEKRLNLTVHSATNGSVLENKGPLRDQYGDYVRHHCRPLAPHHDMYQHILVLSSLSGLYTIDVRTWNTTKIFASYPSHFYLCQRTGNVYFNIGVAFAYNVVTGELVWKADLPADAVKLVDYESNGVYMWTGPPGNNSCFSVIKADLHTGAYLWNWTWPESIFYSIDASVYLAMGPNSTLLVNFIPARRDHPSDSLTPKLCGIDFTTGEQKYCVTSIASNHSGLPTIGPPVLHGDRLFIPWALNNWLRVSGFEFKKVH